MCIPHRFQEGSVVCFCPLFLRCRKKTLVNSTDIKFVQSVCSSIRLMCCVIPSCTDQPKNDELLVVACHVSFLITFFRVVVKQ